MDNNLTTLNLSSLRIEADLMKIMPFDFMRRNHLVPFDRTDNRVRIATAGPLKSEILDEIQLLTGLEPDAYPTSQDVVFAVLQRFFSEEGDHPKSPELAAIEPLHDGSESKVETDAGSPTGSLVEKLVLVASQKRASDIHLEPQKNGFYARMRVDGVMSTVHEFDARLQRQIVSRIKIISGLDINERRLPQDGQFNMVVGGKEVDCRVSTMPCKYGEKIVIRMLDKSGFALGLESLGFDPNTQSVFETLIEKPHGIVMVTGPTGSGKTTTLYSVLHRIRSPQKNIITLEDPIEYELLAGSSNELGTTQIQVNPKVGLTFATGLRSILRQDPDVIMVGEIRDKETAEIAMKAALTGHLVLSTLHTNDAPSSLTRMVDMGIEPYLISSTVVGVLAQRLVRVLCASCKEGYRPPERVLRRMFPNEVDYSNIVFYRAVGCDKCHGTGHWGRQGIFELMTVTEEVRQWLQHGGSMAQANELLNAQGSKNLRHSGMELVRKGLTTVEEVLRSTVA